MNYLIIEDEAHNAGLLQSIVEKTLPIATSLCVLPTVQESVEWLENHPAPDVIFMDIRLADGLSFEIFNQVKIISPVIFTTAYDEYALQAFKVYGAAYLLKPIEKDELKEALDKISHFRPRLLEEEVSAIMEMFRTRQKTYKSRFLLHYKDTYKVVLLEEIDYVCLVNKNVYFNLIDRTSIAVPFTLEELEEQLDPQFFFRVNRQFILHINSIDSIHKYFNDKAKIYLKRDPQTEVIVSRIKMPQFKLWLDR